MRHPDPCYCEQAHDYEDLLNRVLEMLVKQPKELSQGAMTHSEWGMVNGDFNILIKDIEQTIGEYQQAQEEYAS